MKKRSLFLLCIVMIVLSASAVVHLLSNLDVNTLKTDIPNNNHNESDINGVTQKLPEGNTPKTDIPNDNHNESDINRITQKLPEGNTPKTDIPNDNHNESDINGITQKLIDIPAICQYPELPTGCESVAATMVLQYYGVNITAVKFARNWLEYSEHFYSSKGKLYGPDPNKVFAGNPFSKNSYGCYAEPIVNAINRNSAKCIAKTITGRSLKQLCAEYIDNDKPLLIWATMNMKESSVGNSWYFENGTAFTWIAGEHCLVLVGHNDDYYFLNDPMYGSIVTYQKNIVEQRFAELGSQAVYISPNEM